MKLEDAIQRLSDLRGSQKITSAEDWMDISMDFQLIHWELGSEYLAAKMSANKKLKEIRAGEKTKADAEISWMATEEYEAWQKIEKQLDDVKEFMKLAKKQADVRKQNTF